MIKEIFKNIIKKISCKYDNTNYSKFQLGVVKSPKDDRDYKPVKISLSEIPDNFSLREFASEVKNQGNWGSCFHFAMCDAIELLIEKNKGRWDLPLSERFSYYVYRSENKLLPMDCGTIMRDGCKIAYKYGIAPEITCPYVGEKMNVKPSSVAYGFSRFWKIKRFNRCYSVSSIMTEIASGRPVLLGIKVPTSFLRWKGLTFTDDDVFGKIEGGHAILALGYNKKNKTILIKNSWSENWGYKGFCKLSTDFIRKNFIEAWSVEI